MMMDALGVRWERAKHAAQSYVRDRVEQSEATVVSYAVAGGLFAAAGVFLIAAFIVCLTAAFRWIEIRYGLFEAFGALGGLLALITTICAVLAAVRLRRPAKRIVPLASRLRVAIGAPPSSTEVAPAVAVSALSAHPNKSYKSVMPGLLIAASLMGWALVRRSSS
jgi:hypothetical protein